MRVARSIRGIYCVLWLLLVLGISTPLHATPITVSVDGSNGACSHTPGVFGGCGTYLEDGFVIDALGAEVILFPGIYLNSYRTDFGVDIYREDGRRFNLLSICALGFQGVITSPRGGRVVEGCIDPNDSRWQGLDSFHVGFLPWLDEEMPPPEVSFGLAFDAAVPEPATLSLFGLIGLGMTNKTFRDRMRKKRAGEIS